MMMYLEEFSGQSCSSDTYPSVVTWQEELAEHDLALFPLSLGTVGEGTACQVEEEGIKDLTGHVLNELVQVLQHRGYGVKHGGWLY